MIQFGDEEAKAEEDSENGNERDAESHAAIVAFSNCIGRDFLVLGHDLVGGIHVQFDPGNIEGVQRYAGLGEGVLSLSLLQFGLADFDTELRGAAERVVGGIDALLKIGEHLLNCDAGGESLVALNVAVGADGGRTGSQQVVTRLHDAMIAVASDAPRHSSRSKGFFVGAGVEQVGLQNMARRTNVLDAGDAWRGSAVIAMAGCTGRSAEVSADRHSFLVDTDAVPGVLVGGYAVRLHVIGVGVAARAGLGDIQRVNGGKRVGDGADAMYAVAIGTDGDLGISGGKAFTVDAGFVLC